MKIEALDMQAVEADGTRWAITMAWNPDTDVFGISWHKLVTDSKLSAQGYVPPVFEDVSFVIVDNLPGCILNTVQVLVRGDSRKVRGVQLSPASEFPLLPDGNTLLGYIDVLKQFPGFECIGKLVATLGRDEDFLAGIPIHTDIVRKKCSIAA